MRAVDVSNERFAVDTTFVLFFLALDLGQSVGSFGLDSVFSLLTVGLVLVVPYFFPSDAEKPAFSSWLLGRSLITLLALGLGLMFRQALGVVVPEIFGYLPMTLVIFAATASCGLQFCAMIRFRLAR